MSKIKSFRGLMNDGDIETIPLRTNNGSTGYKIIKLQVMPANDVNTESVLKVLSVPTRNATTGAIEANNTIDFSDQKLLAAVYFSMHGSSDTYPEDATIVFDNMIFNQDIYLTLKGQNTAQPLNYYIELEQMKLDLNQNTVATLKDIRNIVSQ